MKKIITLLVAFATFVALATPCFATSDYVSENSIGTVWDTSAPSWFAWIMKNVATGEGDVCDKSPDTHHHASSSVSRDSDGNYVCVCSYCGDSFTTSLVQVKEAEAAAVSALPATGYTSDGTMLWSPILSDVTGQIAFCVPYGAGSSVVRFCASDLPYSFGDISISCDNTRSFGVSVRAAGSASGQGFGIDQFAFTVPVTGRYVLSPGRAILGTYFSNDLGTSVVESSYSEKDFGFLQSGSSLNVTLGLSNKLTVSSFTNGEFAYCFPAFRVVPDTAVEGSPDYTTIYDNSTRVGNYVGSYAVYNSDSGYSYVGGTSLVVNEDNSQVWNPVTNTTTDYSGWTYDYSTRTYNFYNDDNSSTSTVTYGDENMTIADTAIDGNGNTVTNNYTVYYYNGTATDTPSPSPDPSPSPSPSAGPVGPGASTPPSCKHDWTYTVVSEPTCLSAGSKTGVCSLCGETTKETIPATGHTWVIKKSLSTAYDDEGNLVQQGYTIYKCSVCGEEYKDVDGVGPPGSSSEDEGGGFWAWVGDTLGGLLSSALDLLGGLVGGIIDGLIGLLEMLLGKLGTVVEAVLSVFSVLPGLFTGFLNLLSALFPFFPEEIMTILTFGIIACVVIGIIRLIWR